VAARYVPSFELGGDFYDFINLDGHLGVAVCDVSGKGIAASLLMASVRASLRAYAQDVYDIDEIVARVNIALVRDTLTNEFATLFYGVLDPQTRRLTYCNAGHEPPLLLRDGQITRLEVGGTVVGIDPEQEYDKGVVYLQFGDTLLLYTDGLTDAQNFNGEKFGRERINKALRETAKSTAQEAVNHILWEMRRFVGLRSSIDDTTLVVIKVANKK
jgi:phosphoserine phosphatase RsbU/P